MNIFTKLASIFRKKPTAMDLAIEDARCEANARVVPFKRLQSEYMQTGFDRDDKWRVIYDLRGRHSATSWRDENTSTATEMIALHGESLVLFIDDTTASQIMFQSFLDAGSLPDIVSVHHWEGEIAPPTGEHEITQASPAYIAMMAEAKRRGVRWNAHWISDVFFSVRRSGWDRSIATVAQLFSWREATRTWALNSYTSGAIGKDRVIIMAGQLPYISRSNPGVDAPWSIGDHEQYFIVDAMVKHSGKKAIPSFFRYSPMQFKAFLSLNASELDRIKGNDSFTHEAEILSGAYPGLITTDLTPPTDAALRFEILRRSEIKGGDQIAWSNLFIN